MIEAVRKNKISRFLGLEVTYLLLATRLVICENSPTEMVSISCDIPVFSLTICPGHLSYQLFSLFLLEASSVSLSLYFYHLFQFLSCLSYWFLLTRLLSCNLTVTTDNSRMESFHRHLNPFTFFS